MVAIDEFDIHAFDQYCSLLKEREDVGPEFIHFIGDASFLSLDSVQTISKSLCGQGSINFICEKGRVRHDDETSPIASLSECGDERCGAHRLRQPKVRARFRDFITKHLKKERSTTYASGLLYTSIGSGMLLFDLELLERCRMQGIEVKQICLIDKAYSNPDDETLLALQTFADWQSAVASIYGHQEPEILAFRSPDAYHKHAIPGGRASRCNLFVHCDAFWEGCEEDCRRLASNALIVGGLLARLSNLGAKEVPFELLQSGSDHLREYWRQQHEHSDEPFTAAAWTLQEDGDLEPLEDSLLGEDPEVKMQRHCSTGERLKQAERVRAEELGLEVWKVIQPSCVPLYSEPRADSKVVGTLRFGDEITALQRRGHWVKVASSADLWKSDASSDAFFESQQGVLLDDRWAPIAASCFGLGVDERLLEQIFVPSGREPWQPDLVVEETGHLCIIDGFVMLRSRIFQSSASSCSCEHKQCRETRSPAAVRRSQQLRARWKVFVHELQDSSETTIAGRRKLLESLTAQERSSLRRWIKKEQHRWKALVKELQLLPDAFQRKQRLSKLSVEDRSSFEHYLAEQKSLLKSR